MNSYPEHTAYETEDSADFTLLRQPKAAYELTLRVVAMEQVEPHEHYHGPRVADLSARLAAEGKLINPPVVAQQGEKYVVLDGATRLTALRQLGYRHIIVQVVDLAQQQVQLTSWNHVLYGGGRASLVELLRGIPGLRLAPALREQRQQPLFGEWSSGALAYLKTVDGEDFVLEAVPPTGIGSEDHWLRSLNTLVECYGQWGNVERTLSNDMALLAKQFPALAALVLFPRFSPQMILALASQGHTVPAGITRFVIAGRILRLNAPLEKLAADEPLAVKQAWLDRLIRAKLRERQVRYYEEPVVLLDE